MFRLFDSWLILRRNVTPDDLLEDGVDIEKAINARMNRICPGSLSKYWFNESLYLAQFG